MSSSNAPSQNQNEQTGVHTTNEDPAAILASLPEIPTPDLSFDFSSFVVPGSAEEDKLKKRASNVMKLAEENEKLKAELKAMTDRLEAAERRRAELAAQRIAEEPSS